mmetsp:Transcript_18194/g.44208  ORF Transcript_18194/g.44208 Transcript_18194/m.44208 type:complete len:412 (+) Transcript_18194:73-1308(+)
MRTAAAVVALAAAADAFAPAPMSVPRHRQGVPSMSLAPPEAPVKKESTVTLAKERAVQANKEQWGIGAAPKTSSPAAAPNKAAANAPAAAGVPGYRVVTNDEIQALTSKFGDMAREEAETKLSALGYEGALLDAVWKGIGDAKAGKLVLAPHDEMMEEAKKLEARSQVSMAKAAKLEADAAAAKARVQSELEPKVRELSEKLEAAEQEAKAWAWNPFSTAAKDAEEVAAQVAEAKKAVEALNAESLEGVAGAAAMQAASANEAAAASAKMAEAKSLKLSSTNAANAKAVAALEAELVQWEAMSEEEGAAASSSPSALQLLANAGVMPSARAGLNSLAGRVAKVRMGDEPTTLLCDTLQPKKGSGGASDGPSATGEALLGAVVAAAVGGLGWAASQGYIAAGTTAAGNLGVP